MYGGSARWTGCKQCVRFPSTQPPARTCILRAPALQLAAAATAAAALPGVFTAAAVGLLRVAACRAHAAAAATAAAAAAQQVQHFLGRSCRLLIQRLPLPTACAVA